MSIHLHPLDRLWLKPPRILFFCVYGLCHRPNLDSCQFSTVLLRAPRPTDRLTSISFQQCWQWTLAKGRRAFRVNLMVTLRETGTDTLRIPKKKLSFAA